MDVVHWLFLQFSALPLSLFFSLLQNLWKCFVFVHSTYLPRKSPPADFSSRLNAKLSPCPCRMIGYAIWKSSLVALVYFLRNFQISRMHTLKKKSMLFVNCTGRNPYLACRYKEGFWRGEWLSSQWTVLLGFRFLVVMGHCKSSGSLHFLHLSLM